MEAWACVKIVALSGVVCRLAAISRALASTAHSSGNSTANHGPSVSSPSSRVTASSVSSTSSKIVFSTLPGYPRSHSSRYPRPDAAPTTSLDWSPSGALSSRRPNRCCLFSSCVAAGLSPCLHRQRFRAGHPEAACYCGRSLVDQQPYVPSLTNGAMGFDSPSPELRPKRCE